MVNSVGTQIKLPFMIWFDYDRNVSLMKSYPKCIIQNIFLWKLLRVFEEKKVSLFRFTLL